MAITYPISHPATPGFTEVTWAPETATGKTESPYTFNAKVYAWDGQRRKVSVKLPAMSLANAKLWQAWSLKLNGIEGTFYLRDSVGKIARGSIADGYDNGRVNGGAQTGDLLVSDGWPVSHAGLFKAGDWISVADRLYTILDDASSNSAGQATLSVWPFLRGGVSDNAVISVGSDARGIFRLTEAPRFVWDVTRLMSGFSFQAEEAL